MLDIAKYLSLFTTAGIVHAQTALIEVTNDFPGGYGAKVTVQNDSSEPITSWLVLIDFAGTLQQQSEAELIAELSSGQTYAFSNLDYNGAIAVGEERSFQFQVSPDNDTLPPASGQVIPNWVAGNPALGLTNASIAEGNAGETSLEFTVTLTPPPTVGTVTLDFTTQDGSALAGEDYKANSGSLTFAAGEGEKTITVEILGDTQEELDETFSLIFSNIMGADALETEVRGTINDDDGTGPIVTKSYNAWLENYFTTEEISAATLTSKSVDADGDGLANLLEYALGLNPDSVDFSATKVERTTVAGEETLTFSYSQNREAEGITMKVMESTTLMGWSEVTDTSNDSVTIQGNRLEIQKPFPIQPGSTPRFIRIEVSDSNTTGGGEGVLFRLDFETETLNAIPEGWRTFVNYVPDLAASTDSIYVTDAFARNTNGRSLRVIGSTNSPAQIVRELPESLDAVYMQAWFYMSKSMGNDASDNHEHILGIKANESGSFSANDEIRVGQGKGHLGFNHLPSDAISPKLSQWFSGPQTPVNEWFRVDVEMRKNETYDILKMWVNGVLVNEVTAANDWHSPVPTNWLEGKMGFVFFGWHSFSQNAVDMWIDDIVVATEPIMGN